MKGTSRLHEQAPNAPPSLHAKTEPPLYPAGERDSDAPTHADADDRRSSRCSVMPNRGSCASI